MPDISPFASAFVLRDRQANVAAQDTLPAKFTATLLIANEIVDRAGHGDYSGLRQ
jgi:hypothetical protein